MFDSRVGRLPTSELSVVPRQLHRSRIRILRKHQFSTDMAYGDGSNLVTPVLSELGGAQVDADRPHMKVRIDSEHRRDRTGAPRGKQGRPFPSQPSRRPRSEPAQWPKVGQAADPLRASRQTGTQQSCSAVGAPAETLTGPVPP